MPFLRAALAAALALPNGSPPADAPRPRLVVLIVVDQLRGDYFTRFERQLSGGFARFWREGAFFEQGRQDHAIAETAPGHSTLLSGRWPAHTGIVANGLGVSDPSTPLLELKDMGQGASPRRFRGTTLYDWLRASDSASRVLAVSRKDRGAILPVGRSRGEVYYPEPDSVQFEAGGGAVTFPHRLSVNIDAAVLQIAGFPVMDSLTLAFALRGVERLRLARGRATDLLVVSLSTTDAVGHAYGPDSRELHDQVLRVDRWLGRFMDSLGVLVPREATVWALTGDHGITSLPELAAAKGRPAGRVWPTDAFADAAQVTGGDPSFGFEAGLLFGDVARLRARGVKLDSVADALAGKVASVPGVARVYTPKTLKRAAASDTGAVLWRHTIPDDLGWLLCATLEPGYVWSAGVIAEHGTTNLDDQWVPVAFLGPGFVSRRFVEPVSTTDIAPTLAKVLGVRPSERLDGRALAQALARTRR